MKIKSLVVTTILLTSTIWSQAQQINPVPDYVFRNQMSVGRNAVTDTAAYFSIGPRYGATKGFMPPIVGDTATFSSGKRNGLLIFSVQKNKFLYWDSVRVQWSDMAGSSGSYIVAGDTSAMLAPYLRKSDTTSMLTAYLRKGDTASMLSPYYRSAAASAALALKVNISDTSSMLTPYIRHAGYGLTKSGQSFLVDTLNIATRAWRQKGLDSLAALEVSGSGTTNYVPKFTASGTIGNSQIFDNGTSVGINTASPASRLHVFGTSGATTIIAEGATNNTAYGRLEMRGRPQSTNQSTGYIVAASTEGGQAATNIGAIDFAMSGAGGNAHYMAFSTHNGTSLGERLRIFANGRVFVGASPTDAGYQLDINGTLRSVNGANFATTSGNIGIGTTSPSASSKVTISTSIGYGIELENTATGGLKWQIGSSADDFGAGGGKFLITYGNNSLVSPFTIVQSTSNIGISTTSPTYKLDINGTLRSVNGANFATTSGNVGVGTASPLSKLHAFGAGGSTAVKLTLSNGGDVNALNDPMGVIDFYSDDASGGLQGTKGYLGVYNEFNGNWDGSGSRYDTYMAFGTSLDNSLSEKMRIKSDAELLINTTSDAGDYKLQVSGNVYSTGSAVLAATSGELLVGTTSDAGDFKIQTNGAAFFGVAGTKYAIINNSGGNIGLQSFGDWTNHLRMTYPAVVDFDFQVTASGELDLKRSSTVATRVNTAREFMINTTTDAGDYHLQVVGNARVGTGKLDIASNTTFGLGVARSGTSEVAGQIYNSNGILYLGAESSTGGQIFSGSSAYAGVIGTGANYPLQFAVNNITRGGFSTSGNLLLGFTTDSYFLKLQVNGSIFSNNQFFGQGANAQLSIDSSTNISPLYVSAHSLTGTSAQAMLYSSTTWNTTGNPSLLDLNITNTASGATSNYIKITDGTNTFRVTKEAEVVTAAPTGGSIRKWKLGEAATVSPTSPNRTIRVEIDGTVYYLHAKTTND